MLNNKNYYKTVFRLYQIVFEYPVCHLRNTPYSYSYVATMDSTNVMLAFLAAIVYPWRKLEGTVLSSMPHQPAVFLRSR